MKRRQLLLVTIGLMLAAVSGTHVRAAEPSDAALIAEMAKAKVTLQQGLTAAAKQGQPISAKFEVEDGKLQLSVYTAKDGKFSEVIVDYTTGQVAKTEAITEGDDLAAAKSQSAAMAKVKTDLKTAVDKAVSQTTGSKAVGVIPALKDGHAVASVTVLNGQLLKSIEVSLE
jgi:tryptophan synthase beta subunit